MPTSEHCTRLLLISSVSSRTSVADRGSGGLLAEASGSAPLDEAGPTGTFSPEVSIDRSTRSRFPLEAASFGTSFGPPVITVDAPGRVAGG